MDVGTVKRYAVVHTMQRISLCFQAPLSSRFSASNVMERQAVRRSEQASEKMKDIVGEERRLLLKQMAKQTKTFPSSEVVMIRE